MSTAFVYRLFDKDGALLYIGCSNDVSRRVEQHVRKGTGGGDAIASYTAEEYPTRSAAMTAETRAIIAEEPRVNLQRKPRRGVDLNTVGDPHGRFGEQVAWNLAQRMLAANVGLVELARACDMPPSRLTRAFVTCNFNMDHLHAIATALDVDVFSLMAPPTTPGRVPA